METKNLVCCLATAAVLGLAGSAASADTIEFQIRDHPDATGAPPPHGLRMDNLFTSLGEAGRTTFSFNHHGDTILTVNTDGPAITINITGTVYGGRADNGSYGFGEGDYALNFTYSVNVAESGTGWVVNGQSASNSGSLTALGNNAGVASGTTFDFSDKSDGTNSFLFLQDGHRLTPAQIAALGDPWVGRGWVMIPGVMTGTQDFLFTGTIIPLPHPGMMASLGLVGLIAARRRRA